MLAPGSYVADELKVESDAQPDRRQRRRAGDALRARHGRGLGGRTASRPPPRIRSGSRSTWPGMTRSRSPTRRRSTPWCTRRAPRSRSSATASSSAPSSAGTSRSTAKRACTTTRRSARPATRARAKGRRPSSRYVRAKYRAGRVRIVARSSADALVPLLVSIDGAPSQPMRWKRSRGRWLYDARAAGDLDGHGFTVRGSDGSEASATLD